MIITRESPQLNLLSSCLSIMYSLNSGLEGFIGKSAKGVIFNEAVKEGQLIGRNFPRSQSIENAIEQVNSALQGVWNVELFKAKDQEEFFYSDKLGMPSVNIIVRECPIRQAVLTYNLEQDGPLCYLTNGYLCGMISEIMNMRTGMEILHTGPNACLKRLIFRRK